uniref:Uncharacterized protein n=1 Tax=Phaeomonas parva TaxID=124430 RepID=A0A7S1UD72_9STRA
MPVAVSAPARVRFEGADIKANKAVWKPPRGAGTGERWLKARRSSKAQLRRRALHIDPLLTCLCDLRDLGPQPEKRPFCVVGVTMEDIYSAPSDLFVAGMAAGVSHVAGFSLLRYHPHIRMSPEHWWRYGFAGAPSDYSYFEEHHAVDIVPVAEEEAKENEVRVRTLALWPI